MNFWTLGGLPVPELCRRTIRESWNDAVFGQGGRMAFYHFLAIFPAVFVFLATLRSSPTLEKGAQTALLHLAQTLLPGESAKLLEGLLREFTQRALSIWELIFAALGAFWAAGNSTWALIYGLNMAYELEERRSPFQLACTIGGLTAYLLLSALLATLSLWVSAVVLPHSWVLRAVEWVVLAGLVLLSLAVLYRFAPNLRNPKWRWSTPGALCGVLLWIGATVGLRLYFEHINDYRRSYGHLNSAVMLLLWLYVTNGAVLIGGEMNSEVEKAARSGGQGRDRSGS